MKCKNIKYYNNKYTNYNNNNNKVNSLIYKTFTNTMFLIMLMIQKSFYQDQQNLFIQDYRKNQIKFNKLNVREKKHIDLDP